MGNIWFTSDCHYFHNNILRYCNRPFENVEAMNAHLIEQHNKVVKPNDLVYNLGDFSFQNIPKNISVIKQLNGTHRFIRGNHDEWLMDNEKKGINALREVQDELLRQGCHRSKIEWIKDYYEFKHNGYLICMMHFPLFTWHHAYKENSFNLYGHCHATIEHLVKGRQMDVGVDNAYKILGEYRPFSFDEIVGLLKNKQLYCPELENINKNPWDKTNSNYE